MGYKVNDIVYYTGPTNHSDKVSNKRGYIEGVYPYGLSIILEKRKAYDKFIISEERAYISFADIACGARKISYE